MHRIRVIDSHTGGEPTRVVVAGGPNLGRGPLKDRREVFQSEFDLFRSAIVNEPRGSDVLVGVLLVEPHEPGCSTGAIFFNSVGPLGMCGHATIGLAITLAHFGRTEPGEYRIDTPVGVVGVSHRGGPKATISNVPSYRHATNVSVQVDGIGVVAGDVAWGGNWFFLTPAPQHIPLSVKHVSELTDYAKRIQAALRKAGVTGVNGREIDHIELMGPPVDQLNHARNFVLCPSGAYDRSPCGTGTSAKLACLAADGKLKPGELWRQESVLGSVFEGRYEIGLSNQILPQIAGEAFITGELELLFDPADPFKSGVRP